MSKCDDCILELIQVDKSITEKIEIVNNEFYVIIGIIIKETEIIYILKYCII